jgi:hypothetical protein
MRILEEILPLGKCLMPFVLNAVRLVRFPLSLVMAALFTAEIASNFAKQIGAPNVGRTNFKLI